MAHMKFNGDATQVQIVRESATECAKLAKGDRCDYAGQFCVCIHEQTISRGLSFDA